MGKRSLHLTANRQIAVEPVDNHSAKVLTFVANCDHGLRQLQR